MPVFLRGKRNYIQGTQMIARASERLGEGRWTLKRAQFAQMTANAVAASPAEIAGGIGAAEFESADAIVAIWNFADTGRPAERRDDPMGVTLESRVVIDEASVEYEISSPPTFEGLLNALVQATKGEHEERYRSASDVWLTGFRNIDLPVSDGWGTGRSVLRLTLLRRMGRAPQFQTYWSFELRDAADPALTLTGATSFAYKQETADVA